MANEVCKVGVGKLGRRGPVHRLFDTFTDPNGTQLIDHHMNTGPGWVYQTSPPFTAQILNNRATGEAGQVVASANAGVSDGVYTAIFNPGTVTGLAFGSIYRILDNANYIMTYMFLAFNEFGIRRVVNGSNTYISYTNFAMPQNTDYELVTELSGTTITARCNGAHQVVGTVPEFEHSTLVGMVLDSSFVVSFDMIQFDG